MHVGAKIIEELISNLVVACRGIGTIETSLRAAGALAISIGGHTRTTELHSRGNGGTVVSSRAAQARSRGQDAALAGFVATTWRAIFRSGKTCSSTEGIQSGSL